MAQRILVILSLWISVLTASFYASTSITCQYAANDNETYSISISDDSRGTLLGTSATGLTTPHARPTHLPFSHRTHSSISHHNVYSKTISPIYAETWLKFSPLLYNRPVDYHIYRLRRLLI